MKQFGRFGGYSAVFAAMAVLAVGAGSLVALADEVVNAIDNSVDNTLESRTIASGNSTVVEFYIKASNNTPQGDANGCNATEAAPATVNLTTPAGVTATPSAVVFDACGGYGTGTNSNVFTGQKKSVTFSSSTPGSHAITVGSVTGGISGSLWATAPAAFTLVVTAPVDSTPPVITPSISGTLGTNGWYTSNVTVSWSVTDAQSPVTSMTGCTNSSVTTDTAGVTFTCGATSGGGTASQSVVVKRDATAPTISSSVSPARPGSGWWNEVSGAPTASFDCDDAMSGVPAGGCEPAHVFGEGENQSKTGTATDRAGNTASTSVSNIDVDLTDPTADASLTGDLGDNGWFVGDIAVDWTVADGLSGPVASSCPDTSVTTDAASADVTCTPTDVAGNTGTAVAKPYQRDATKPTISAVMDRLPDPVTGWFNIDTGAPTVSYTCDDTTSGIKTCSSDHLFGEGTGLTDTGTAVDNAGNADTATVSGIDVDLTAPEVTFALTGTEGTNDWYTSDVTIEWTVKDGGSGVATGCVDETLTTDTAGYTFTCTATDNAGNSTTRTKTVKRDATAPVVTWNGLINDGDSFYFGSVPASPTCSATDALSGMAGGCTVGGHATSVGPKTLTASAKDLAGNTATQTRSYTVLGWTPSGFHRPVDMGTVWNSVKGGSTVPLKFEVFAGSTELTDVGTTVLSYNVAKIPCAALGTVVTDPIEVLDSTGGTTMRYDWVDGQFIQNWKTPKTPGLCYQATVKLKDGSRIDAYFKLK